MYGEDPSASPDYGRIVSTRHTERLVALLDSGHTAVGGQHDVAQRYVAPTVLTGTPLDSPVMQEEIFGPVLPVLTVADADEAVGFITSREKPLAMYAFTEDAATRDRLLQGTSSGSLVFGAAVVQVGMQSLPFGGVGASGMGAYHGEQGMRLFSHERSVLRKRRGPDLLAIARPPFTAQRERRLRRVLG